MSQGDLIETFMIVTGRDKVKMEDFFECNKSNYNLHGHQFKMTVHGAVQIPNQVPSVIVLWIFATVFQELWFLQVQ